MATKVAMAIMRDAALETIERSAALLTQQHKLDPLTIPRQGNDLELLAVRRLEAIASWLDCFAQQTVQIAKPAATKRRAPARRKAVK